MKLLVAVNSYNEEAYEHSYALRCYIEELGLGSDVIDSKALHTGVTLADLLPGAVPSDYGMAVVLGGDGTVLRVSHLFAGYDVPIVGINFGTLGFLTNPSELGVRRIVADALAGELVPERRSNVMVDVFCQGDDGEGAESDVVESPRPTLMALNEVALTRGSYGSLIDFDLMVAGTRFAPLRADGIIVASATGSTGYALSAGGPVVAPGYRGLLTIPIAPHTLRSRAIVSAPGDVVEVLVHPTRDGARSVLALDGEAVFFDNPVSRIVVRTGEVCTTLLRYQQDGFYQRVAECFF